MGTFIEDSTNKDDFVTISSMLRKYLPETDTPYILDIDLDFFSTRNPFKTLYERVNLYDKLISIFAYKHPGSDDPEILKESREERKNQLSELKEIFEHLSQNRSLSGFDGEKTAMYEGVDQLCQELKLAYPNLDIDWTMVYTAGLTIDDKGLPEHVTEPNDLDRLISGTFRSFLAALPTSPTIVTIARSSDDEYTPPESVDQIQIDVLDQLNERVEPEVDLQLIYQENEEQA